MTSTTNIEDQEMSVPFEWRGNLLFLNGYRIGEVADWGGVWSYSFLGGGQNGGGDTSRTGAVRALEQWAREWVASLVPVQTISDLKAVLCDPEGVVAITGSQGDRELLSRAVEMLVSVGGPVYQDYYNDWQCAFCSPKFDQSIDTIAHDNDCVTRQVSDLVTEIRNHIGLSEQFQSTPQPSNDGREA